MYARLRQFSRFSSPMSLANYVPLHRLTALVASHPSFPRTQTSLLRCSFSVLIDDNYRVSVYDTIFDFEASVFDRAVSWCLALVGYLVLSARYCCLSFCPSYHLLHSRIPHPHL